MRLKYFYKLFVFISLLVFIFILGCKSSSHKNKKVVYQADSLQKYPYWIAMMNDPNVNYYEAVKSFEKYWEHREKPTEDDGEGKDIFGKIKTKEEETIESNRSIEYVYEYKQFLNWQQRNKNLVKADGHIMSAEEIIQQWQKLNKDTLKR